MMSPIVFLTADPTRADTNPTDLTSGPTCRLVRLGSRHWRPTSG